MGKLESILFIEDDRVYGTMVEELHAMVRERFYGEVSFKVVTTWPDGVAEIASNPPSVVLLDLSLPPYMPQSETIEAFRSLAETWPPTIALTGNKYDLDLRRKCIMAGCTDFILKGKGTDFALMLCERIYNAYLRRMYEPRA